MKNIINIGIPSKGRLRKDVLNIFKKKKLKLVSERGERDLIGSIKNKSNIKSFTELNKIVQISLKKLIIYFKTCQIWAPKLRWVTFC